MKKLISFLMCVTMLLTMLAPVQTAWAQTVPPPGKKYFEKLVPISKDDCSGSLTQAEDLILFTDKIESINAEDGILSIISNFTAEEWRTLCTQYYNTYKDTGKYTGEITAKVTLSVPEGAKKVAFTYIDDAFGASDDDLDAKLEYFNAPSDSGKWFDLLPEFPTISYHDISVGTISDFALTFNRAPKALLVCWLDENGNKIELAEGQYIGFTLVNFIHEFEQNDNLLFNPNHPLYVPYSRGWDIIEKSWSNDFSNSQLDSIFTDEEKVKWTYDDDEGLIDVELNLNADDWRKIYMASASGVEVIDFRLRIPRPEGAARFAESRFSENFKNTVAAALLDTSISNMSQNEFWYPGCECASVRRYDGTIMIEPTDRLFCMMAYWCDKEGKPIDIAADDNIESSIEYLRVNVRHTNNKIVTFTDDTQIPIENIKFNTGDWDSEYYGEDLVDGKEMFPEYKNSEIVYFFDYYKVKNLLDGNSSVQDQNKYKVLHTAVKAPSNAQGCTVNGNSVSIDNNGYITLGKSIYNGSTFSHETKDVFTIVWDMGDGTSKTQRLTITATPVMGKTSMDIGGWTPVPDKRIKINQDYTGSTGFKIEVAKKDSGHLWNRNTGKAPEPVPHGAVLFTIEAPSDPDIIGYRMNPSSGGNVYDADQKRAEMQRNLLNATPVTKFSGNDRSIEISTNVIRTFVERKLTADKGGKNITVTVYFPEIYGNSIRGGSYIVIDWMKEDGTYISEYVYHTNDKFTEKYYSKGNGNGNSRAVSEDSSDNPTGYSLINSDNTLVIETFAQDFGTATNKGAEYVQLSLEDENGNPIQPGEGGETVRIAYPDGTTKDDDFTLEHYKDESHTELEVIEVKKHDDYIEFTTKSFSPFMLSWEKTAADDDTGDDNTGDDNTGDDNTGNGGAGDGNTGNTPSYPEYDDDDFIPINPSVGFIPETIVPVPVVPSEPEEVENTFSVLCNKLNIRAGAGTGFEKIGTLRRGASIKGELLENGWIKFTMENGEVGYISGKYVYMTDDDSCTEGCEGSATVICGTLNVRSGPDTSFDKVGKIKRGDTVYIVSCDATHSWYKIIWNDAHAWISAKYVYTD